MSCRLVPVGDAFADTGVDDGNCSLVSRLRGFFVAFTNGRDNFLHRGAHAGTQAGVMLTPHFGLTGAFLSLDCISQLIFSCG